MTLLGTGAVISRLQASDYRTPAAEDRVVLARVIADWKKRGGGVLQLEPGRVYDLGRVAAGDHVFDLRGLNNAVLDGRGATLRCTTAGSGKTQMFLVRSCRDLAFANLRGEDRGANLRSEWRGMDFIHLDASDGVIENVSLDAVTVQSAVSLLSCSGGPGSPRMRGLRLTNVEARDCYYGLSFQENGDDVSGSFRAYNCRRAYFPYGVRRHSLALDIHHDGSQPGADACILIKRYLQDTQDISLQARFSGKLPWRNLLKLEAQAPAGALPTIRNIDAVLDVDAAASPLAGSNLVAFGSFRNGRYEAETDARWEGVRVRGCSGKLVARVEQLSKSRRLADVVFSPDRQGCG